MKTMNADQAFYDLRWSGAGETTERERNRVATTVQKIPEYCRSILDVGAGNGFLSNELVARGKSVVAVDISEVALSKVNAPTRKLSADNLVGIEDRSFDLVLCTEMLEHLDEATYRGALREFDRVARHAILITVPNQENMLENTAVCGGCGKPYHIWGHRRCFAPSDLVSMFSSFTPVSVTKFGNNLRRYNPILLKMRTGIAKAWASDEISPCPECHSFEIAKPVRPRLAEFCNLLNSNLPRLPYRPWLLALYGRVKE